MVEADTLALSREERRRSLAAAIACMAVFGVTVALMSPLISLILESRGVDRTTIGALASMPALAMLATNPLLPWFVRRFTLRGFLLGCIGLELVFVLLMPALDNLFAWFVLRGFMGATVNGLFVASETWINAVAEERSRGRVIAIYGAVLAGSFALGPLIVPITGIEGWPPFLVAAGFIAIAAVPLIRSGRLSPVIEGHSSFGVLAFFWVAPTLAAAILLSSVKEMSMTAMLPVYGVRSGLSEGAAAAMLTASYTGALLFQLPIGWLADRIDRTTLLIALTAVGLAGTLLLPAMVGVGGPVLWVGLALWIGLYSGVYVVAMALVGERFRGPDLVTANASIGLLWGLGSLTGPVASGTAMDLWDPHGFPAVLAVVTAVVLVIAVVRRLRGQRA